MYYFNLKKNLAVVFFIFLSINAFTQDNNLLLKEAKDLELKFDAAGTAGTSKAKYKISSYGEYYSFLSVDTILHLL